jgi:hypothetical protein
MHKVYCLTKLSQIIWSNYVPHSKFGASSSPKEKNPTPSCQENEGAKANHPVYSSVGQEIAPEDIA